LSRRAPDVPAQGTGQVRLVEVLELGDDIGDRDTGGQQRRRLAYAFDLPYGALVSPVAARNRRSMVRPETSGR
jgi:hypothetical protein